MCLPARPRLPIKRPTSAALSVWNLSTTPDAGSYVFRVNVATCASAGGGGAASASASPFSPSLFRFAIFFFSAADSAFGILYLVVILVYAVLSELAPQCCGVSNLQVHLRTVVGRACSSSIVCCCHSSAVFNNTIFCANVVYSKGDGG